MENKIEVINIERIKEEFSELVRIDSVTFSERKMADRLTKKLKDLKFQVTEDLAGAYYGGNAGNLYGFLKGTLPGPPILLSAHMDTVEPGLGKQAVFHEDGKITSSDDTVLGADDLSGVVEILEGIRCVQEMGLDHRDIEILFPIGEEAYVKGTDVFDFKKIKAKEAYVLDMSGPIGTAALKAPSIISFKVEIHGRAAHAGFEPERGIHAISIMSNAIAKIRQGRFDEETTFNIGTISGGKALNIVPEICTCTGEVRSYHHEKALKCIEEAKEIFLQEAHKEGAVCEFSDRVDVTAYKIEDSNQTVKRFQKSCRNLGIEPELTSTFGGSDNNNFVKNNINGIVLSCGMYQVHSTKEYALIEELKKGAALVAELLTQ
ncbi:MAG: M20/M25/M40 family metallo-hydrolase [Lachnospiraceae bacterium]|nr:M20/M25/M40 family metallo-hydrolase [Lachnospiraceae bacterium]